MSCVKTKCLCCTVAIVLKLFTDLPFIEASGSTESVDKVNLLSREAADPC